MENMLLLELDFYAFKSDIKHFKCTPYDGYCSEKNQKKKKKPSKPFQNMHFTFLFFFTWLKIKIFSSPLHFGELLVMVNIMVHQELAVALIDPCSERNT